MSSKQRGESVLRKPFLMVGPWCAYFDERSGREYFANVSSGEVSWNCPPAMDEVRPSPALPCPAWA